jgi:hypothetical protein
MMNETARPMPRGMGSIIKAEAIAWIAADMMTLERLWVT